MFPIILNDYVNLQHKATYAVRDLTIMEELRAENSEMPKSRRVYARLHDIIRWAMVVCEILEVNIKTLEYILECHDHFMHELSGLEPKPASNTTIHGTHQYLRFYAHMVYSMNCRCASYRDRMKNEIQLVFNVVAQSEARASMAIAMATKADSETMKATSLVALVFLPPTFISAVFSTTFFQFGSDRQPWEVSEKFWLYWAVVVPVTMVCIAIWYMCFFRSAAVFSSPRAKFVRQRRRVKPPTRCLQRNVERGHRSQVCSFKLMMVSGNLG